VANRLTYCLNFAHNEVKNRETIWESCYNGMSTKTIHKTGGTQMVKQRKKYSKKKRIGKGFKKNTAKARKINASTPVETCSEQLSPFGGLLALVKFFDLVKFEEIFNFTYQSPRRKPKLGHYSMMIGILIRLRRTVYRF